MISSASSNSVISYTSPQQTTNASSAEDIFNKLFKDIGGDSKTITKDQLNNYIKKVESGNSGTVDKNQLNLLYKLQAKWDTISGNGASITQDDLDSGISHLQTQKQNTKAADDSIKLLGSKKDDDDDEEYYPASNESSSVTTSFYSLAAALGASGGKITKEQLIAYLQSLTSNSTSSSNSSEISFVKNLLARFDTLSNGADYITSFVGVNDAQDYSTVTSEQVTSPIDIRI